MTLRPEIRKILDDLPPERQLDVRGLSVQEALERLRNRPTVAIPVALPARVTDTAFDHDGVTVPLRIYTPSGGGAAGILLNCHGGGWVMGTLDQDDLLCHSLANEAGCIVVSVDYRLAPEHRYPAALDDCYAAARWAHANARRLGAASQRMAIIGSSAGGNLAAAVALKARDTGEFPLHGQILLYPICDCDFSSPSYIQNAKGYFLSAETMRWFWDQYVPDPARREDPYASPCRATRFDGLPPSLIMRAQYDPLRDEAAKYGASLKAAGVEVAELEFEGLIHGFFRMIPTAPWTRQVLESSVGLAKKAFHE